MARVFISYRDQQPDSNLARYFYDNLIQANHSPFLASEDIRWGQDWEIRIMGELDACDYFFVLLSEKSLRSEMVAGEVRRAKELHDTRSDQRPVILPLRIKLQSNAPADYELDCYLHKIQQLNWYSEADTAKISEYLLKAVNGEDTPIPKQKVEVQSDGYTELKRSPPFPTVPLELPEGMVREGSKFYVERSSDQRCFNEILRQGSLIRIKAPRQFGKTSLLSRLISYVKQNKHSVISLSFQQLDTTTISDLDRLLQELCIFTLRAIKTKTRFELDNNSNQLMSPKQRCTIFFEDQILPDPTNSVVLCIDEADRLFEHRDISTDFFGLLRYWHEEGKRNTLWEKLKIIVAHSTEAYLAIDDLNQSPFNVGLDVKLNEFSILETLRLAKIHGIPWDIDEVKKLVEIIGGHPFLVRKSLYHVAEDNLELNDFINKASRDDGPFSDHLRRHLWNLKVQKELGIAMKQIVTNEYCNDQFLCYRLKAAGLIRGESPNVQPSFALYRQYFQQHL